MHRVTDYHTRGIAPRQVGKSVFNSLIHISYRYSCLDFKSSDQIFIKSTYSLFIPNRRLGQIEIGHCESAALVRGGAPPLSFRRKK